MIAGNNKDPISLLHGWGMNASVFKPLCEKLSLDRETLNIELPGHGKSAWDDTLSFEQQAARIADKLPGGTLLGWSMGGLYAIEMVRQNPARFSRLILVCSNPCFVTRPDWPCAVSESVFDDFAGELGKGWATTIRRFLSLQMLGNVQARRYSRELMSLLETGGEPDLAALEFGLQLLKTRDCRPALAGMDLPIQMILGRRDALVPYKLAEEIRKVNSKIQVESIAAAAHAPFLSHPDQFASMIQ
jgi:pimeloyl-[acyl-carrier protein] methyl ester esterase